jgi:hypothetical protein
LCALKFDFFHRRVRRRLRGFQILAQRRYAQHATAIGDDLESVGHPGLTAEGMGFSVQIPENRRNTANVLVISMLRQLKSGWAARSGGSFDRRES